ncbi:MULTISPECIES: ubiquitin carboxyl-hydrolase [Rahnella]|uniref:terminase small subunit-like protein n=1 Tax=Rahnella TaxID=34037 RepID=UPI001C26D230|nr:MULTISPECIES: ubiquitin carboxyl-hydrolase [Rahnella]MBU9829874.1 ubiquitin carboxyl-hydrolase [Rahnella rivi]
MAAKNKGGRPSDYTPELAERICNLLMEGESLRAICKRDDVPHIATVLAWLHRHEEFHEQYVRAREIQAEVMAEDIIMYADSATEEASAVAKARLQVDARKWYASKVATRRYGDRVQHDQRITITDMTDDELQRKIMELTHAESQSGAED